MSDYDHTTVTREPERVVVRERGSSAGWWVAAVIAIIAIFGVLFLVGLPGRDADALQAARDQGAAEASLANAAADAQAAASNAAGAAQDAASGAARATESAAQAAAAQTEQAAAATAEAARDISTTEPDPR